MRGAVDKTVAAPLAPFDGGVSNDAGSSKFLADLGLVPSRFYLFPGVWGLHKGHDVLTEAIEAAPAADPVVVTCGMSREGINGSPKAVAALRNSLADRWDKLIESKKLVVVVGVSEAKMQALRNGCRARVCVAQLVRRIWFPDGGGNLSISAGNRFGHQGASGDFKPLSEVSIGKTFSAWFRHGSGGGTQPERW